jgi:hypothetical protein
MGEFAVRSLSFSKPSCHRVIVIDTFLQRRKMSICTFLPL